jgi:hypothetical protein
MVPAMVSMTVPDVSMTVTDHMIKEINMHRTEFVTVLVSLMAPKPSWASAPRRFCPNSGASSLAARMALKSAVMDLMERLTAVSALSIPTRIRMAAVLAPRSKSNINEEEALIVPR